eukprot:scaffold209264_cov39-Prasinocladus_malaysianus.AAC.1
MARSNHTGTKYSKGRNIRAHTSKQLWHLTSEARDELDSFLWGRFHFGNSKEGRSPAAAGGAAGGAAAAGRPAAASSGSAASSAPGPPAAAAAGDDSAALSGR